MRKEYSYPSGRVLEAYGKRGHKCRVHKILLDVIVCKDYEKKNTCLGGLGWLGSGSTTCDENLLLFILVLGYLYKTLLYAYIG